VDEAGALIHRDLVPFDDAVLDTLGRRQVIERSVVAPADELGTVPALDVGFVGVALDRNPLTVLL